MPVRLHIAIGASLVAMIGAIVIGFMHLPRRGELFDKRGWSVLQGMDDPPPGAPSVILLRKEEFAVIGFRGLGQARQRSVDGPEPHWSWMLLNEHQADGEIKQMPEFAAYDLNCAELHRVEKAVRDADTYAVRYLHSICT